MTYLAGLFDTNSWGFDDTDYGNSARGPKAANLGHYDSTTLQAIDVPKAVDTPTVIDFPQVVEIPEAVDVGSPSEGTESPDVHTDNAPVDDGVVADEEFYIYSQKIQKVRVFLVLSSSN
jgi:hypothetical protein